MKVINKKACKEVYEILKYIPDEDYEKVPKDIIKKIEENMDMDYKYEVKTGKEFDNSVMLKDTENMLAFIFKNYWATDDQNELINEYRKNKGQLEEVDKRIKYNPDDIFNKQKIDAEKIENDKKEVIEEIHEIEETSMVEVKEGFFKKLINYLKNLLKIKK